MKNVFLSGPHGAYEDLSLLADALGAEEMEVWRPDRLVPGTGTNQTEEVLSAIKRCDLFVALIYKAHPNVMFELGYALGAGKSVLLIRGSRGEIPFDVATLPALTIDRFDSRSISEAVQWIKQATVRSRPAIRDFQNAQEMLRRMCDDESFLDEVEPRAFEECIAKVFQEKGFRADLLSTRNDRGFDVEIRDFLPNEVVVVQVKKQNRNSRLSVSEVQRVVGSAVTARAARAIIVTSGGFTASAKFFADEAPIRVVLLTIDELADLTREGLTSRCA
jgi:nucleoside 2-deoxyribosyltransferase